MLSPNNDEKSIKHLSDKTESAGEAVRRFRAKQKEAGLSELRGIFASGEEQKILKLEIRKRLKEIRVELE